MRILILCTGNSCRSQMAEGFVRSFDPSIEVISAGTQPGFQVHPRAVAVMKEIGIDLSRAVPKNVDRFTSESFEYVITVCDHARETCPVFIGKVGQRLHMGFRDPAEVTGKDEEVMAVFRRVRDEIGTAFRTFYSTRVLTARAKESS